MHLKQIFRLKIFKQIIKNQIIKRIKELIKISVMINLITLKLPIYPTMDFALQYLNKAVLGSKINQIIIKMDQKTLKQVKEQLIMKIRFKVNNHSTEFKKINEYLIY